MMFPIAIRRLIHFNKSEPSGCWNTRAVLTNVTLDERVLHGCLPFYLRANFASSVRSLSRVFLHTFT